MSRIVSEHAVNENARPQSIDDLLHRQTVQDLIDGVRKSDNWLIRVSDWCSPILVKEVRQALKSRQFNWTLVLLMIFIALWTTFAIVGSYPGVYYIPAGQALLYGFFLLLLVPIALIVPNAAYRSMASELDQGTFDVLSITPLSPFQIVIGKLAVAMVQNMIFFSALGPCMAMCYLLRGVPILGVALLLGWMIVVSFAASSLGVLLATGNQNRSMGTFLSILMIIICVAAIFFLVTMYFALVSEFRSSDSEIIIVSLGSWVMFVLYSFLALLAASAAIGVAGENYSTRIRWWMLLISLIWIAYFLGFYMMLEMPGGNGISRGGIMSEIVVFMFVIQAIHWSVCGVFLIAERGVASPRAQRRLPNSLLERMFLSWANPGSGTGYIFTLVAFGGSAAGFLFGAIQRNVLTSKIFEVVSIAALLLGYLIIYLGLTRLVLVFIDRFPKIIGNRMMMSPALTILFVLMGTFGTLLSSGLINRTGNPDYEWYSVLNPFWTIADGDIPSYPSQLLMIILSLIIFSLNFATLTRHVTMVRVEDPPNLRPPRLSETKLELDT